MIKSWQQKRKKIKNKKIRSWQQKRQSKAKTNKQKNKKNNLDTSLIRGHGCTDKKGKWAVDCEWEVLELLHKNVKNFVLLIAIPIIRSFNLS